MRVGSFPTDVFNFPWDLRSMHLVHFAAFWRQAWASVVACSVPWGLLAFRG